MMRATMPPSLPRVRLRKELRRHIQAGHPWIWADALEPVRMATGTVVDVVDGHGFVARGLFDARSPIGVRVATLDVEEAVDDAFLRRRLASALAARRGVIDASTTDCFRWCNGEGDFLPGVVVDVYGRVAVVRLDGDAVRVWRDAVADALLALGAGLGIVHVYERSRGGQGAVLRGGPPPVPVDVREHGVRFSVDVVHGQKTGFFLDQRDNRRAIQPFCDGARVANLFGYTGGFSVYAALAGARHVTTVDSAPDAIRDARNNFALNGLNPEAHAFVADDCFAFIERTRKTPDRFDLMIVDPPSFAPSEKALKKAVGASRDLFAAALALVAPGGLLAAASCSSHVDTEAFFGIVRDAGAKARRPLRVLESRGQPADHPTLPAFAEGRYLKFVLARAD